MTYLVAALPVTLRFVSEAAEMSLAQRVLLTWVFALVFLITLVLKLDEKVGDCIYFWGFGA